MTSEENREVAAAMQAAEVASSVDGAGDVLGGPEDQGGPGSPDCQVGPGSAQGQESPGGPSGHHTPGNPDGQGGAGAHGDENGPGAPDDQGVASASDNQGGPDGPGGPGVEEKEGSAAVGAPGAAQAECASGPGEDAPPEAVGSGDIRIVLYPFQRAPEARWPADGSGMTHRAARGGGGVGGQKWEQGGEPGVARWEGVRTGEEAGGWAGRLHGVGEAGQDELREEGGRRRWPELAGLGACEASCGWTPRGEARGEGHPLRYERA